MLELDAFLNLGHDFRGLLQLREFRVGERLPDDIGHATAAQHARQREEHVVLDTVLALKIYSFI